MASAEQRYRALQSDRDYYLSRARTAARLTIPYLIPSSNDGGSNTNEVFTLPWNGIGARGVHNLASRLLMALLPPTETFFRFTFDEIQQQQQEARMAASGASESDIAKLRAETEVGLSRLERSVLRSIETSNDRVVVHEALIHLVIGGNALLYVGEDGLQVFHLNRYVLMRDPMGAPVEAVVCEEMDVDALPKSIRDFLEDEEDADLHGIINADPAPIGSSRNVKIFTHIKWEDGKVRWHQEVKGKEVEGSHATANASASPWLPLRMIRQDGSNYGPGYVESACIADLQTAEALNQAVAEGSLVSAQVRHLVKPSGVTSAKALAEAPNGAFLPGNPDDVFTVQTQKSGDLQVAMMGLQRIETRLAQAFMLADVRDSERTTAEEVRLQAQQLEMALGSVWSILTVEMMAPYVMRKLELFVRKGGMKSLPEDLIKPVVSVGLAAVGRGNDLEKTARFMTILQQTLGPEGIATYVNPSELIKRLASSMGMDVLGLVKTEDELAAEQQQQQQMMLAQQAMASPMADPQKQAEAQAIEAEMAAPPEQATA